MLLWPRITLITIIVCASVFLLRTVEDRYLCNTLGEAQLILFSGVILIMNMMARCIIVMSQKAQSWTRVGSSCQWVGSDQNFRQVWRVGSGPIIPSVLYFQ